VERLTDSEITRQAAKLVMGWNFAPVIWGPLTSILDAFEMVDEMRKRGLCCTLTAGIVWWECTFYPSDSNPPEITCGAKDKCAGRAITLAAIKAMEAGK